MRYQVPQFIEVEDKIFGPLTLKQFIYLVGSVAVSYFVYALTNSFLPIFIILILVAPILAFGVALAFYKLNNKPLINVVEAAVKFYIGSKLYIWKKDSRPVVDKEVSTKENFLTLPKLADSKLKDLAWNLDISHGPQQSNRQI